MRTSSKNQLPGAIGAVIGLAIVAVFASGAVPTDSGAMQQLLLTGENLGLGVAEFLALGFLLGLGAFGVRQLAVHINDARLKLRRSDAFTDTVMSATSMPIVRLPDVTASGFENAANTAFAPVTSLTEAQVQRTRAERKREERRTTLKGA
jgi:hypothetical protein